MGGASSYKLKPDQIPVFPEGGDWSTCLRWCVAVMDHDDEQLGFAASLFSYAIREGGLTERQERWARKLVDRIKAASQAGLLAFQGGPSARREGKARKAPVSASDSNQSKERDQ